MGSAEVKFVADHMLGRLAKWIRVLGYDVVYRVPFPPDELLRIARAEGRIVLTRSGKLAGRCVSERLILIRSQHVDEQLAQVIGELQLDTESGLLSRCLICNLKIKPIPKGEVEGQVPEYVYSTQDSFSICPGCGRIYWAGTHYRKMKDFLERVKRSGGKTRNAHQ